MILRIRPSNVKGYLTPYRTGEDEAVDRYCASLVLAMSAYCPEFIVSGVNVNSPEVDRFTSILLEGGIRTAVRLKGISMSGEMDAVTADLSDCPELLPILTVMCATAKNACCLSVDSGNDDARELLKRCQEMADDLGADTMMLYDRMMIKRKSGPKLIGGIVNTCQDYRLAGACALAGLVTRDEISVSSAESINRVYPKFWQIYRTCGGDIYLKDRPNGEAEE